MGWAWKLADDLQIKLKDPGKEWKIYNLGFVETYDFFVRFERRYKR